GRLHILECQRLIRFMPKLVIAVEVVATSLLPSTDGFRVPLPSVVVISGYVAAFALFAQAVKTMPVSTAYAMWSGIGTAAVALIGFTVLGEQATVWRVLGIVLVSAGLVLLQAGGHSPQGT
ncbi:MAG: SMR family transporter, partial [Acidimicrobiia bacterium]